MLEVSAIICPKCKDLIFSRAGHDLRRCSCGDCFIDGGFEYQRVGFNKICPQVIKLHLDVPETFKKNLYDDWNKGKDKFGLYKKNQYKKSEIAELLVDLK